MSNFQVRLVFRPPKYEKHKLLTKMTSPFNSHMAQITLVTKTKPVMAYLLEFGSVTLHTTTIHFPFLDSIKQLNKLVN
ncbi:hypothetical protein Hanom_Chr15g01394941 [Helianthus anomalus]